TAEAVRVGMAGMAPPPGVTFLAPFSVRPPAGVTTGSGDSAKFPPGRPVDAGGALILTAVPVAGSTSAPAEPVPARSDDEVPGPFPRAEATLPFCKETHDASLQTRATATGGAAGRPGESLRGSSGRPDASESGRRLRLQRGRRHGGIGLLRERQRRHHFRRRL